MQSVKFAQMVTIQMIIWSYFVRLAISVYIKDVLDWQKYQLKVGFAMFA